MDCIDSQEVHDEIRQLAIREKKRITSVKQLNEDGMLDALRQYGPAPGAQKMMDKEMEAALHAIESGMYVVFRSCTGEDCTRVAPSHICFCGCTLSAHNMKNRRVPCTKCKCDGFQFMFQRPEEIGEYWLVRRKDFNIHTWAPKCRCKHTHKEHHPEKSKRCRKCGCPGFQSDFLCLVCDKHWEDHETVFETERERRAMGKPVGEDFKPLAQVAPEFGEIVFGKKNKDGVYVKAPPTAYQQSLKREHPSAKKKALPSINAPDVPQITTSSSSSSSAKVSTPPKPRAMRNPSGPAPAPLPTRGPPSSREADPVPRSKFCTECGAKYSVETAKFCSNCGTKRL